MHATRRGYEWRPAPRMGDRGPVKLVELLRRARQEELQRGIHWLQDSADGALGRLPQGFSCRGHDPVYLELLAFDELGAYAWRLRNEHEVFHGGELPGRYDRGAAKRFAIAAVALLVMRSSS
jgi:hypothetical protein